MLGPKPFRWLAGGLLTAAFVTLLSLALRPPGIRLADGTYLRLLGTTVGPGHVFSTGEQYERRPFVWLPAPLRERMGWRSYAVTVQVADAASLIVWFTSYVPATGSGKPRTFNRVELVDARGQAVAVAAHSPAPLAQQTAGLLLFPGFTNFPPGARLRFTYGPLPGTTTEAAPPRRVR